MKYIDHFLAKREDDVFLLQLIEEGAIHQHGEWLEENGVHFESVVDRSSKDTYIYMDFHGWNDPKFIRYTDIFGKAYESKEPHRYQITHRSFNDWVSSGSDKEYYVTLNGK